MEIGWVTRERHLFFLSSSLRSSLMDNDHSRKRLAPAGVAQYDAGTRGVSHAKEHTMTQADIEDVLSRHEGGESLREIAHYHGVSHSTVARIVSGEARRHARHCNNGTECLSSDADRDFKGNNGFCVACLAADHRPLLPTPASPEPLVPPARPVSVEYTHEERASWTFPIRESVYPCAKHPLSADTNPDRQTLKHCVYIYRLPGNLGTYVGKSSRGMSRPEEHRGTCGGCLYIHLFSNFCGDRLDDLTLEVIPVTRENFPHWAGSLAKLTEKLEEELIRVTPLPLNKKGLTNLRTHRPEIADFVDWMNESSLAELGAAVNRRLRGLAE